MLILKRCVFQGSFPCKKDGPLIPGHEFVGTIDELGSAVINFKVGQRVAVDPNSGCNKCDHCHSANYHYCQSGGINNCVGIFRDGGWTTHALVPETQVRGYTSTISCYPYVSSTFAV